MENFQNVLVIVAHTDDEALGLGGTIARHIENGDKVFCISMTDGISSRDQKLQNKISERITAANNSSQILGFKWFEFGSFPDNAMDKTPLIEIVKFIEKAKKEISPKIIYTHSPADLNIDHRLVCQATLTAFRPQPKESFNEIRTFEVPSSTDYGHTSVTNSFNPNLFIDISNFWSKKLEALHAYDAEIREIPHTRSYKGIQNLAQYRGNQVGLTYAEAFEVIRKIVR